MDCSTPLSDHKQNKSPLSDHKQKNKTTPLIEIDAQWHKAKAQDDIESDMDMM